MLYLHKNPLIWREWRIATRPRRLWGGAIGLLILLILAYSFIDLGVSSEDPPGEWTTTASRFSLFVIGVQVLLVFLAALGATLDTVVAERLRKTYDFLVTLPISGADKVVGLALGSTLPFFLAFLVLTPIGIISGLAGRLDPANLMWFYLIMFTGYLAVALTGMAWTSSFARYRGGWLVVLVSFAVGAALIAAPLSYYFTAIPVLTLSPYGLMVASFADTEEVARVFRDGMTSFYGLRTPWQLCPVVFYLFVAALSFAVATRKLSKPEGRPLPRWAVIVAMFVFQFLLFGFLRDALFDEEDKCVAIAIAHFVSFFVIIASGQWLPVLISGA